LAHCKPGEACRECGTSYDREKALRSLQRQTSSYLDIVEANLLKEGKDAKKEIMKIQRIRSTGDDLGNFRSWRETDKKLQEYLRKKGHKSYYISRPRH
jgi:hypothetical protein